MATKRHIYALFDSPIRAVAAYAEILRSGCTDEHCSAIVHEKHIDEGLLPSGERAGREAAGEGAALAGAAGAAIAGLAALGGGIFGIGPIAAAAAGGGVMAAYGALLGAISGSDDPERHLRELAEEVEAGRILIAVETDNPDMASMCQEAFEKNGADPVVF